MTRYVLSPRAQQDIEDIWDYTADRWDADQADQYTRGIQSAIEAAADNPQRGRPCDDVRPGYFKLFAGSHAIFYRLRRGTLDVVRILHGRMDFDHHL